MLPATLSPSTGPQDGGQECVSLRPGYTVGSGYTDPRGALGPSSQSGAKDMDVKNPRSEN